MQFSNSNLTRDTVLSRFFPQYRLIAPQTHTGLSGASCIIEHAGQRLVLRQYHAALATPAHFRRQYHALRHLPADIAPQPRFYSPDWIAVDYLSGEIKTGLPAAPALAAMLYHLHQQPRFGWRITLAPLLEQYWLQASPSRRTPLWLRWHKRLQKRGIALELASVWSESDAQRQLLLAAYSEIAQIDRFLLQRQVNRWRPWVLMLMAGWFELRWQQSQDKHFITLADKIWRQLETTE